MRLGDAIERALEVVGIDRELVERWVGDCGCDDRRDKLNAIGLQASRILSGRLHRARELVLRIIGEDAPSPPPSGII